MKTQAELKRFATKHQVPVMMDDGLQFLLETIMNQKGQRVLEIGTAIAKTAIAIASLDDSIQVTTIERDPEMIAQAKKNIKEAGLEERIHLIEGDANEVSIPSEKFDIIFIDAAKAQYQRFFAKYSPLLSEDCIIISDNMSFHGLVEHPENTKNRNTKHLVRKIAAYKDFLKNHSSFDTIFYSIGDGVALTRRK